MWKKIRSNRDPRDTLSSELYKEFSIYFIQGGSLIRRVLAKYPKPFFGTMVVLMLVSMVLSFVTFKQPEQPRIKPQAAKINPLADGFSQILMATVRINETIFLKRVVDSLTAKKRLSADDSLALESALNKLQKIQTIK